MVTKRALHYLKGTEEQKNCLYEKDYGFSGYVEYMSLDEATMEAVSLCQFLLEIKIEGNWLTLFIVILNY